MENIERYNLYCKNEFPDDNPWDDMEEQRTIAGYVEADDYEPIDMYDPICDNCFHLYEIVAEPPTFKLYRAEVKSIAFRLTVAKPAQHCPVTAKIIPYQPRFGHIGYAEGCKNYSDEELELFYDTLNFDLAWPKVYM
ncbi:MAG: hypothetical protein LBB34_02275 [Holosporales bacterium]|nr:hypothetical protein [Holosporales bacterium]